MYVEGAIIICIDVGGGGGGLWGTLWKISPKVTQGIRGHQKVSDCTSLDESVLRVLNASFSVLCIFW